MKNQYIYVCNEDIVKENMRLKKVINDLYNFMENKTLPVQEDVYGNYVGKVDETLNEIRAELGNSLIRNKVMTANEFLKRKKK